MLFDIRPGLPPSRVFEGLNAFLREILLAALQSREEEPGAMPDGLHAAVVGNGPTLALVEKLRTALADLEQPQKADFSATLLQNSEPCIFLGDRALHPPPIPEEVFPHLKALAIHLYTRTGKLVGVVAACGECIDDHYARFRRATPPGNGNVCCVCETESLSQVRIDVEDHEQWRGPYDHLLAKDSFPLYSVHPFNLVPICNTCNSKAKLAKNLLLKDNNRRLSFSPWTECVTGAEVTVTIDINDVSPRVIVNFDGDTADRREKLNTWNDVYVIKDRVEGEFVSLHEKIAEDISIQNEEVFTNSLRERAIAKAGASRITPFNYWRARVFNAVANMDAESREALRRTIAEAIPDDQQMEALFLR